MENATTATVTHQRASACVPQDGLGPHATRQHVPPPVPTEAPVHQESVCARAGGQVPLVKLQCVRLSVYMAPAPNPTFAHALLGGPVTRVKPPFVRPLAKTEEPVRLQTRAPVLPTQQDLLVRLPCVHPHASTEEPVASQGLGLLAHVQQGTLGQLVHPLLVPLIVALMEPVMKPLESVPVPLDGQGQPVLHPCV